MKNYRHYIDALGEDLPTPHRNNAVVYNSKWDHKVLRMVSKSNSLKVKNGVEFDLQIISIRHYKSNNQLLI